MLTVEEARERVLSHFQPLAIEDVSLNEALGRVLAEDAVSREALPAFANSAMDGYARRAEDSAGATAGGGGDRGGCRHGRPSRARPSPAARRHPGDRRRTGSAR